MQLRCSAVVKIPGPTPRSCSRRSYRQRATFQNAKMRCLAVCLIKMCRDLFIGISGSCRQRAKLFRCDMLDLIQDYSLSLCRWASWSSHLTKDHALEVRSLRASENRAKHLEALSISPSISFNLSPISTKPCYSPSIWNHSRTIQHVAIWEHSMETAGSIQRWATNLCGSLLGRNWKNLWSDGQVSTVVLSP